MSKDPRFVASYRIGDFPHAGLKLLPWKVADCDSVLINAYDYLENPRTKAVARKLLESGKPAREQIDFAGPLMMDSGAYYFVQSQVADICPEQIVKLAYKVRVPAVVALDHPFPPDTGKKEMLRRISVSANHTETMRRALGRYPRDKRPQLLAVLHGHDKKSIASSYEQTVKALGYKPDSIGLGSLAPLAKVGSIRKVVEVVRMAKTLIGDANLHVFSVGSPLLMHFAFLSGANSVDSQSWMISAAFKQAQLPGTSQLRLSYQEAAKDAKTYEAKKKKFARQLLFLAKHEGFTVKDWVSGQMRILRDEIDAFDYLFDLEDRPGENRVHWRACHNLHVATSEARMFRNCGRQTISEFLTKRQALTPYKSAMEDALEACNV